MNNPLHEIFIQEAEDNLTILESAIISIEENPDDDKNINEAFRSIHSIKGGAGLAGFSDIKDFAHIVEDLFECIRNGSIRTEERHISIILKSLDIIKLMVSNIKDELEALEGIETEEILSEIKKMIAQASGEVPAENTAVEQKQENVKKDKLYFLNLTYYPEIFMTGIDPVMFISDLERSGRILSIKAETGNFPEPEDFDPEKLYLNWKLFYSSELNEKELLDIFCFVIDESEIKVLELTDQLENIELLEECSIDGKTILEFIDTPPAPEKKEERRSSDRRQHDRRATDRRSGDRRDGDRREPLSSGVSFIRVPTNKLENIFNTVSELLISQARLNMLTEEFEDEIPDSFSAVADSLKNITNILQEQVTSLRMMSLGSTFDRFKRVVRDIATERGKKVKLTISGQETELDKNMIEKLNDPLKHLVRNCIDHGLETEKERIEKGKSPEGNLLLSAYIENGKVIIEVADDGAGIDKEKLLSKALEKGLIHPEQQLSDGEIMNLIFHPGLSTAKEITDLSGRGVGMDVVKSSIMELHGNI